MFIKPPFLLNMVQGKKIVGLGHIELGFNKFNETQYQIEVLTIENLGKSKNALEELENGLLVL